MRKRRLEKQSQGETLLGWDRARGKGRHSLALSVAIPGFSLKMVFLPQRNYSSCTLELYDSKLPFKRSFHMHFLPSFFLLFFLFLPLCFVFFPCSLSSVLSLFLSFVCLSSPPAPADGRTFWMLLWRKDQSIAETRGRQNMRLRFRKPGVSSWLCH